MTKKTTIIYIVWSRLEYKIYTTLYKINIIISLSLFKLFILLPIFLFLSRPSLFLIPAPHTKKREWALFVIQISLLESNGFELFRKAFTKVHF